MKKNLLHMCELKASKGNTLVNTKTASHSTEIKNQTLNFIKHKGSNSILETLL